MSSSRTNTVMVSEIVELDDDTDRVQLRVSWGGSVRTWALARERVAEELTEASRAFASGALEP